MEQVFGLEQPDSMLSIMGNARNTFSRFAYLCPFTYNRPVTFPQTSYGDRGKKMMSGEFVAMSAIYNAVPDLAPRPIAWGTYESIADVHFFLCDFHEMTDALPDMRTFPTKMAELHKSGNSPNGKFGFPVTTYHGNTAIQHGWSETWEEYFTVTTKRLFELEQIAQGPNEDIRSLTEPFFAKVVPRLLRPLENGGRSIKPCLIHGDLWHGNATMDAESDRPIIFDAASSYAHNECRCTTPSPHVSIWLNMQTISGCGVRPGTVLGSRMWNDITSIFLLQRQKKIEMIGMPCMPRKSQHVQLDGHTFMHYL